MSVYGQTKNCLSNQIHTVLSILYKIFYPYYEKMELPKHFVTNLRVILPFLN